MEEKELQSIRSRFKELNDILSKPEFTNDMKKYQETLKEFSKLKDVAGAIDERENLEGERDGVIKLLDDSDEEIKSLAKSELEEIEEKLRIKNKELDNLLREDDPLDSKDVIMEIRAGTGGDESALFAADLFRMYSMYAEKKRWKVEIMNSHPTGIGGFKEIIFSVKGKNIYKSLRFEKGVHRVQRIPVTESSGRIHTSAVTVAVLPEVENEEFEIKQTEIKIDVFRSSGHGGQSVNTTDSAVRITHLPTGIVVSCQDERSQHKNRAIAMRVLRARLYNKMISEKKREIDEDRKKQVGSGDRSERIRTYNFPQNRVTDHRVNLTLYKLESIINGEIGDLIDAFRKT